MIDNIITKFIRRIKVSFVAIGFVINFIFLMIYTAKESKGTFLFAILTTIFTVLMFTAKFSINKKYIKYLLCIIAFFVYIIILKTNSMQYTFDTVLNKWSFLVIAYILLVDNWFFPFLVGMYPALMLLLLIPVAKNGNSSYVMEKVLGNLNGQVAFTVSTVIMYQMFSKIIIERNKYRILSNTDSLTGVANLTYTIETAKKMIQKGNISILLTDMDRFKQVNDTYGHVAGNKVLIEIAKLLENETEGHERVIGRLGGDEFIIVIRNDESQKVQNLGKRLLAIMAEKFFVIDPEMDPINLSFSVGQANSTTNDEDIEKLLQKADIDMYYNKYRRHRLNIFINKETPILCKEGYELLNVLAEKDMYTYVHSGYTAQYAAALAKELGYSNEKIEALYNAGWLHDIGKVLISNDIVRKSGTLSEEEYAFMKKHVNYGINIVNDLDITRDTINCIQYHHEFWDGSGYPKGLSGNDIPQEARILQIADSYSAMIIKRVYRKTFTQEQALEEIIKNSGKQFDPDYVKVFVEFVKSGTKIEIA